MADAYRDQNDVPTLIAASSADGKTPVRLYADPTTHRLLIDLPGGGGTVTSVDATVPTGLTVSGVPITTSGTIAIALQSGYVIPTTASLATYVVGPASATDNAVARFDTTTGKLIQNSAVLIADTTGIISGTQGVTFSGSTSGTIALVPTAIAGTNTITLPASTGTVALTSDIPSNVVTAAATFATDESILRSDGTSRGAQATSTNATLTDAGALTLASLATAAGFAPTSSTATGNRLYLPTTNTLGLAINGTGTIQLTSSALSPVTNDIAALGTTALGWADLFSATGFTWNISNGNWVATHTSGVLTVGTGDLRISVAGTNADSVVTNNGTQTLANKRNTPRITTIVSSATPTVNSDGCDAVTITALATAITSMTTNLSGTPTNFQTLIFRIKDDGTARAITWGASFVAEGTALPTTTVISKVLTVGFIYDSVKAAWGCVASQQET